MADLQELCQSLTAAVLLEAIDLHLDDQLTIHLGRTQLRDSEETDVQLDGPAELDRVNPDRPIDGLGEFVASEADDCYCRTYARDISPPRGGDYRSVGTSGSMRRALTPPRRR